MKNNFFALLFLGLTSTLFAQRTQGGGPGNFSKLKLTGVVLDKESQEPLEYATISLINKRFPERIQGGITDAKEKFNPETFRFFKR